MISSFLTALDPTGKLAPLMYFFKSHSELNVIFTQQTFSPTCRGKFPTFKTPFNILGNVLIHYLSEGGMRASTEISLAQHKDWKEG